MNYKTNNRIFIKILIAGILLASISGCGVWTNFKTYFNTYYNANKIFEEAEQGVFEIRNDLFYYEEIPITKTLSKDFDIVIEKTSAILQHNKESDYVPDALLMTGKSFYYQQNYSRALRKFNELATREDSELLLENKLWIGKTYLQMREFDRALMILEEVREEAKSLEEEEILIEVYKSEIGYLIYIEDYSTAVNEINELINTDIEDELRAEVLYELGRMYKLTGDYESAAETFLKVSNYSPTFEVDFNSKFESAKIKGEIGQQNESMELLQDLRDEDKFSDNWGDIDLEIGKIYYDRNEIEEALDKFTEVDTTYSKTEAASIAGFYRAEILEDYFHDYDSALVFYKAALSSIAPLKLRNIAKKKSQLLNQYLGFHTKLGDLNKQYLYLTDDNAFIQDSIDYEFLVKQDSINAAEQQQSSDPRGSRQNKQVKSKYKMPIRPKIPADSLLALKSKNHFELANLLFAEFNDPDSAFYYYNLSLEEDPDNPNEAQTYYAIGNYFLVKKNKEKADSMFSIVYDKFEFNPIRNEAAKHIGKPLYDFDKDPVEDEYIEAEAFYDSLKYGKAISKLFQIYKENPKSIYASKSLYTIGFILENELNMPDSAASVYDTLSSKYATSEYSKSILVKLNTYKSEQLRLQAVQDSIKKAAEIKLDSIENSVKQDSLQIIEEELISVQPEDSTANFSDSLNSANLTDSSKVIIEK